MKRDKLSTILGNIFSSALLWTSSLVLITAVSIPLYAGSKYARSMTTVQYNNAHTGWNPDEVVLNTTNVNPSQFGKLWTASVEGQLYGAPLYVSGVEIEGKQRDVVYMATGDNFIYALDAETGAELWPAPYFLGPYVPRTSLGYEKTCQNIGSISPNVGITSTPVIDLARGTLYAVGLVCTDTPCLRSTPKVFEMAAVDIATGQSQEGWPVRIEPPDTFLDTQVTSSRGALLLANNTVYVPFGGYSGDCGPYHGWIVGVDKTDPNALQISYRTPGTDVHRGSGIWASGGIAADAEGDEVANIYPATGNSFGAPNVDYSNAVLRLGPDLTFSEQPEDFFMPSNWTDLNSRDHDLGSSTPMLLPPQPASNTQNMIFVAGKRGVGHLINRDNLGGIPENGDGVNNEGLYSTQVSADGGVFSTAAYYEDPDPDVGPTIFLAVRGRQPDCDVQRVVAALALDVDEGGNSSYHTKWCVPSEGNNSAPVSPVITSAPGETGILWVVTLGGVFYAFNAATGEELYNSNMVDDDRLGSVRNFLHFTVIDGKVFIGNSSSQVVAYGLTERKK